VASTSRVFTIRPSQLPFERETTQLENVKKLSWIKPCSLKRKLQLNREAVHWVLAQNDNNILSVYEMKTQ